LLIRRLMVCCQAALFCFTALNGYSSEPLAFAHLLPGELLHPIVVAPGTIQDPGPASALHIVVVSGEDGINIVKKKTAVQPVVEVRDRNNQPVAGAVVTFTLPNQGPGAVFLNGSRSVTVVSDATGRAAVVGMKPVGTGTFKISVSASSQDQVATAAISQVNVMTAAATAGGTAAGGGAAAGAGLSAGMIGIIVGVAAAAAIGIGVGLAHHGGNSAPATPTATIGVGTGGTVGAPH
jgi:hypothetical protein